MSKLREIYNNYSHNQRKVKFEAWDSQDKKMIQDFCNYAGWQAIEGLRNAWCDDQYIKRQFTGLKDKNGKEIYEGDIIEIELVKTDWEKKKRWSEIEKFIVVYDHGSFCLQKRTDKEFLMGFSNNDSNGFLPKENLIGNIYENPELLQK